MTASFLIPVTTATTFAPTCQNTTNEYTSVIEQNLVYTDQLGRLRLSLQRACASECQIRLTGGDT